MSPMFSIPALAIFLVAALIFGLIGLKRVSAAIIFISVTLFFLASIRNFETWLEILLFQLFFFMTTLVGFQLGTAPWTSCKLFLKCFIPGKRELSQIEISRLYNFMNSLYKSVWKTAWFMFIITSILAMFFNMAIKDSRSHNLVRIVQTFFPTVFPWFLAIFFNLFFVPLIHGNLVENYAIKIEEKFLPSFLPKKLWLIPLVLILMLYWPYVVYLLSDITYVVRDFYRSFPDLI